MYIYIYVCVCVCTCICMCMCMCVYILLLVLLITTIYKQKDIRFMKPRVCLLTQEKYIRTSSGIQMTYKQSMNFISMFHLLLSKNVYRKCVK